MGVGMTSSDGGLARLLAILHERPEEIAIVDLPFDWATPLTAALTAALSLAAAFGGVWYAGRLNRRQADGQYQRHRLDYNLERASKLVAIMTGATNYLSTAASHTVQSNRDAIRHGNLRFRWAFVRTPIMTDLVPDQLPPDCAALLLEFGEIDLYESVATTIRQVGQFKLTHAEIARYRRRFDELADRLTIHPLANRGEEGLVAGLAWSPEEHPDVHRIAMTLDDFNMQLLHHIPDTLTALGKTIDQLNAALKKHKNDWGLPPGFPETVLYNVPGDIAGDPTPTPPRESPDASVLERYFFHQAQ